MTSTIDRAADQALKARHRAIWALGDYPAVAMDVIPELGPELVAASRVHSGDRVLDVAAGTGNAAVPATLTGATVIASDLTPEFFVAGREFYMWVAVFDHTQTRHTRHPRPVRIVVQD